MGIGARVESTGKCHDLRPVSMISSSDLVVSSKVSFAFHLRAVPTVSANICHLALSAILISNSRFPDSK